jgi:hypothetical protein
VKEHSMMIADEMMMTKKEKDFKNALQEFDQGSPSHKETRLPKIEN